jgi:hypothetical protein
MNRRVVEPPRHIVWSSEHVDLADPFQRRWYMRQVLINGRAEDVRRLDLDVVASELDDLDLPPHLHHLWQTFLEMRANAQR